jgi:hypothetical protein
MPSRSIIVFRRLVLLLALLAGVFPAALRAAAPKVLYPTARFPHQGPSQVALSGDTLVFASSRLPNGAGGRAWVYRRNGAGWQLDAVLRPPRSLPVDAFFGTSVAIDADTIVIGAPPEVVYIFVRQPALGWVEQAAVLAPPSEASPNFGFRVAISGDELLVGGPSLALSQRVGGSAFAYRRVGDAWRAAGTFFDSQDDFYGSRIALDGPLAAIAGNGPIDTYLFGEQGWVRQATVAIAPDATANSISLSGDVLAVGSFNDGVALWQFHSGTWALGAVVPIDSSSVVLSGDTLAVAVAESAVYVYQRQDRRGPWLLAATLVEPSADPALGFPGSIALGAGTVVASSDNPVWVFTLGD